MNLSPIKRRKISFQRGGMLMELLASVVIIGIVSVGLAQIMGSFVSMNRQSEKMTVVTALAQRQLEKYLSDFTQVPASPIELNAEEVDAHLSTEQINNEVIFVVDPGDISQNPIHVRIRVYQVNPQGVKGQVLMELSTLVAKQKRFGQQTELQPGDPGAP